MCRGAFACSDRWLRFQHFASSYSQLGFWHLHRRDPVLLGQSVMKAEDHRRKSFLGAAGRAAAEWDVARRRTLTHRALRGTLGALGVEVARVEGAEFGVALYEGALSEVAESGVALFEAARVEDAALEVVAFDVAARCDVAARFEVAARLAVAALHVVAFFAAALEVVAFFVAAPHGAALEVLARCDVAARSDGAALECPAFDVAALVAALEVDGIQVGLWKVAEGKDSDG